MLVKKCFSRVNSNILSHTINACYFKKIRYEYHIIYYYIHSKLLVRYYIFEIPLLHKNFHLNLIDIDSQKRIIK